MEQYQQTGAMSEQDYMDTATEEMKQANRKYEGKEKGGPEFLHRQSREQEQDRLKGILRHPEGEEGPKGVQLKIQQVGWRHHHGYAEIGPGHERHTEAQAHHAQHVGGFRIQYRFFHLGPSLEVFVSIPRLQTRRKLPVAKGRKRG